MEKKDLRKIIVSSLTDIAPNIDTAALESDKSFRDQFEFDSIDHLNFVLALEKALEIRIPELDYPKLAGLGAAEDYLSTHFESAC